MNLSNQALLEKYFNVHALIKDLTEEQNNYKDELIKRGPISSKTHASIVEKIHKTMLKSLKEVSKVISLDELRKKDLISEIDYCVVKVVKKEIGSDEEAGKREAM